MDVSKSEPEICQGERIGLRRGLSRYRSFLISRKLSRYSLSVGFFILGIQIFDSSEIYQGEERGQFQVPLIFANGPAVGFSKRYPTTAPPQICHGRPESCHGARRVRRGFCHQGTSFIDHYACRGTKPIDGTKLSKRNKCYKKALEQHRGTDYPEARKLSSYRRQSCGQVRASGYKIQ